MENKSNYESTTPEYALIQFRAPSELRDEAMEYVKRNRRSMSEWLRMLIERELGRGGHTDGFFPPSKTRSDYLILRPPFNDLTIEQMDQLRQDPREPLKELTREELEQFFESYKRKMIEGLDQPTPQPQRKPVQRR